MKVIYNGGTDSYYGCSDPKVLVKGREYEVINVDVQAYYTNYTLKGVEGVFNSVWFDDIEKVYLAVSELMPMLGRRFRCIRLEEDDWKPVITTTVEEIEPIGGNVYRVKTCNSIYVVQVN